MGERVAGQAGDGAGRAAGLDRGEVRVEKRQRAEQCVRALPLSLSPSPLTTHLAQFGGLDAGRPQAGVDDVQGWRRREKRREREEERENLEGGSAHANLAAHRFVRADAVGLVHAPDSRPADAPPPALIAWRARADVSWAAPASLPLPPFPRKTHRPPSPRRLRSWTRPARTPPGPRPPAGRPGRGVPGGAWLRCSACVRLPPCVARPRKNECAAAVSLARVSLNPFSIHPPLSPARAVYTAHARPAFWFHSFPYTHTLPAPLSHKP